MKLLNAAYEIHIHVCDSDGRAKFWIEPEVALEKNYGLKEEELCEILNVVKDRKKGESKLTDVLSVELYSDGHICWPALDVDLSTEIIENPDRHSLKYKRR